jgi:cyclopropane-fatty-acyl-phospholipid synthase
MNPIALHVDPAFASDAPRSAKTALALLRRLKQGTLTVQAPDGSQQRFGSGQAPHASLHLHNWSVCELALKSGDIGFAQSYIQGDWTSPDVAALLRLFIANRQEVEAVIYGTWWGQLAFRIKHWLNRNSKTNSRKNIHTHYDLGNGFYELWLDKTMNYSSALFDGDMNKEMGQAQDAKVRRALRMAGVTAGTRVLEIGCGWGALAEKAALENKAHITGVTLSTEQLDWAKGRLAMHGAAANADLRLQDYRDIGVTTNDQPFDAICSIEMFEAVGHAYWTEYFQTVARLLKPGGLACIQSITIDDSLFERYLQSTDFIQQYIFPGGCLPSPSAFRAEAAKAGLEVVDQFAFGRDYAETLRRWRKDFLAHEADVLALQPRSAGQVTAAIDQQGSKRFDKTFMRTWEFYLAYCEAAFDEGSTDVMQFTLRKPA